MLHSVISTQIHPLFKAIKFKRLCLYAISGILKIAFTFLILFFFHTNIVAQTDPTFKKALISDKEMMPISLESVPSGGFIVGGMERGANEKEWTGFMLKLTENGETEWKRSITSDSSGNFQQVKPTKDGGFMGVNNYLRDRNTTTGNFTTSALTWCKTNAAGTIQWAKTIREGTLQNQPAVDLEIGDDGSIWLGCQLSDSHQ
jgi:hypothetical protein